MKISTRTEGKLTIASIEEPRMDAAIAPELKNYVSELIASGATHIVLDISAVQFMDSSSLGAMVSLLKMAGNRSDLIIAGANGIVADLFKLTRMERVFHMVPSIEDVLAPAAA